MPFKDKDKNRDYQKEWARKNRVKSYDYRRELRKRAINKLGGKCVNCGCNDYKALEINHINGGGGKEHKEHHNEAKQVYLDIINGKRQDLDLRCKVCNALHYLVELKGLENYWNVTYNRAIV
jgi:adenine-specific DNA methylase